MSPLVICLRIASVLVHSTSNYFVPSLGIFGTNRVVGNGSDGVANPEWRLLIVGKLISLWPSSESFQVECICFTVGGKVNRWRVFKRRMHVEIHLPLWNPQAFPD